MDATHRQGCDRTHSDGRGAPCNTRGALDRLPVEPPGPTLAELFILRDAIPRADSIADRVVERAIALRVEWLSGPLVRS